MTRGGTFQRWMWRRVGRQRAGLYELSGHGAYVYPCWGAHGQRWQAEVFDRRDRVPMGRIERFSRRCDAKRWCERMLADGAQ